MLQHVDLGGHGLEIGASYNPIVSKREGYDVEVLDHCTADELRAKYAAVESADVNNIEEVDHVWKGEPFVELIGKQKCFDYIIASHVIEHTPDLVGFINGCETILRDSGVLVLAVPDMRYTFDRFRRISSTGDVLRNHLDERVTHQPGAVFDFCFDSVRINERTESGNDRYALLNSESQAQEQFDASLHTDEYVDIHNWCFVPSSFALIIDDLRRMGLINMGILSQEGPVGIEFYVTLGLDESKVPSADRLEMLRAMEGEMLEVMLVDNHAGTKRNDTPQWELQRQNTMLRKELDGIRRSRSYALAGLISRTARFLLGPFLR